ncbi:MAG: polysaccharide pyruvyl transferase family protein [Actinomycetota bacterium]
MRVAIWGSYKHGNFGDDLMAVLFARRVREAGSSPIVLQLDPELAARLDLHVAGSVPELLDEADLCVMGGGAMLEAGSLRWAARGYSRDLERDLLALWRCARGRVPVHASSIGGSGATSPLRLSPAKAVLLRSGVVGASTVRLPEDVLLLRRLGVEATYHPDVVLGASRSFAGERTRRDDRFRVGVNLNVRTGSGLTRRLLDWAAADPAVELVFLHTHLPGHAAGYEVLPDRSDRVAHHRYRDPDETTAALAELDVLVSSKLHVGVTALSYDVPFVSYAGKAKSVAFLRSIGADHLRFRSGEDERVVSLLERALLEVTASGGPARSLLPGEQLRDQRARSHGHTDAVDELLGLRRA